MASWRRERSGVGVHIVPEAALVTLCESQEDGRGLHDTRWSRRRTLGGRDTDGMTTRAYYSMRMGRRAQRIDLATAKRLFTGTFTEMVRNDYFEEFAGYECVDAGQVPGTAGSDIPSFVFRKTLRDDLWPVEANLDRWTEDAFMDAIEFLYDQVSKPIEPRYYHDWSGCGYHDKNFDKAAGRDHYRSEINEILQLLDTGWELSADGEVLRRLDAPVRELLERPLPSTVAGSVQERVDGAIRKFRLRSSSRDDRRDAVRDLVDVLEFLRPQLKQVLTQKDDALLFDMANNFGIRHFNEKQHATYDAIWLSWMFHFLLATIHAGTRFLGERNRASGTVGATRTKP
jgi:hypothetical protein